MAEVFLFCLAGVALAQPGAIVGQVFEADLSAPIEYANVVLRTLPESTQVTGTVTDKTGAFRLDGVKPGRYYVELSFIGYRDRTVKELEVIAGAQLDLGRLSLEQKPIAVPGVEAIAEKPAVSFEVDKKVVDVSKLATASSGTAVDALENVPSVKVDVEGNVTVRGSSDFKVLVDGRPGPLEGTEALRSIPAATIDKIEVITNPSVRYDPEGTAGIINVLLKKQRQSGFSALANGDAGLRNRYGGDLLLSHKSGIVSAYLGGQLGRRVYVNSGSSETRTFGSDETLMVASTGSGSWLSRYGAGRAGIDLQFTPRDRSSISARAGTYSGGTSNRSSVSETWLPSDSGRSFLTDGGWGFNSDYWFAMYDHEHDFDTASNKLTGRVYFVSRAGTDFSRNVLFDSSGDTFAGRKTEEVGPWRQFNGELEYQVLFPKAGMLYVGYAGGVGRVDLKHRLLNYDPVADSFKLDERSSHPYYGTQSIHSIYAMFGTEYRGFGVQAGLRPEYGQRFIDVLDTTQTWQTTSWELFPSLGLSYKLPHEQQLTASYSRRVERPEPYQLVPFLTWTDEHNAQRGNPDLLSSYGNSWEAGYELPFGSSDLSLQGYWRTTSNMVEDVTRRDAADTTLLLHYPDNIGQARDRGLELSANLSPVKWFSAYVTGDFADHRESGVVFGDTFERGSFNWQGSLRLTATLPTATQLQLSGRFNGPEVSAQGDEDAWFSANAAVKQFLFNRALTITLRCSNLFGPTFWKSRSRGQGFATNSTYTNEGYVLSLAVSYNLNNFKYNVRMRAGEGVEEQGTSGAGGGNAPQR
jgi:outer membrane receptor protein involved in Fe transport